MNSHTPGPWHVGASAKTIVYASDGFAVSDATVFHGRHEPETSKANAALIAEAPAMLEALRSILAQCEDDSWRVTGTFRCAEPEGIQRMREMLGGIAQKAIARVGGAK